MRVISVMAVAIAAVLAILVRCCDGANLRGFAVPEEDEEFRVRPLYRDYNLLRRAARADDAFDDYGHLRFGRSDD
ncbi:drosulfakinin [Anticarsia gemmatalis]|uniref:drosulfakinin n=1 Tax=Anticarsia gemmatalis TaxID=129554 RepID=UPI003F771584